MNKCAKWCPCVGFN